MSPIADIAGAPVIERAYSPPPLAPVAPAFEPGQSAPIALAGFEQFALAGDARFTVRNENTGKRFTYRVTRAPERGPTARQAIHHPGLDNRAAVASPDASAPDTRPWFVK